MKTIVKDYGVESITLSDGIDTEETIATGVVWLVISLGAFIFLSLTAETTIPDGIWKHLFIMVCSGFVGIVFVLLLQLGKPVIPQKKIPVYRIDLDHQSGHQITIIKTIPEQDQKAVCEAVQKLEPIALKYVERICNLRKIAYKCK